MSVFKYKTYNSSGKMKAGIIDADSSAQASAKLKNKGLFPFELIPDVGVPGEKHKKVRRKRVKKSEVNAFTRQLTTLISSGMHITESLTALAEQGGHSELSKIIVDIKEKVSSGSSFSEALSDFPRLFSTTYVNLVKAGETGGGLDEIMEELAELGERQEAIKSKVTAALAYPIIMTIIGTIVMGILFTLVIPQIISIFDNMSGSLPLPTRLLIGTTNFIQGYWVYLLIVIGLTFFAAYKFYKTKKGRYFFDNILLKIPFVGDMILKVEVSRFSRTLSLLLKGGVPVTEALEIVKNVVKSSILSDIIAGAKKNLSEGGDIASALKYRNIFPPVAIHMIAVGEKGGKLEQMLLNVANSFDRDVESVASALTSILEPLLIVAMGLMVGFIALAVLLPIFEMNLMVG